MPDRYNASLAGIPIVIDDNGIGDYGGMGRVRQNVLDEVSKVL